MFPLHDFVQPKAAGWVTLLLQNRCKLLLLGTFIKNYSMDLQYDDILALEKRYRTNLINSLGGFKSLLLIGTKSQQGNSNLATFSSFFHLGAHPPYCGIVIRPNDEKENTLGNIMSSRQYTLNQVTAGFYKQAHQCSAKYPAGVSEFEAVGLTQAYEDGIYPPFVAESQVKFACELVEKMDIPLNGTFILIGRIIKMIVPDDIVQPDGFIDLEKAGTLTCSGLDSYHSTQQIARLSYAKADKAVEEITAVFG